MWRPATSRSEVAGAVAETPSGRRWAESLTASLLAVLAGVGVSVQALVNGHLSTTLRSPELATMVNQTVGVATLLAAGLVSGAWLRAWRRLQRESRIRWWHLAVGVNGAAFIMVSAAAAPKVGVTLLAVFLVAGQTTGGLITDRLGLSPAGRTGFTSWRLGGASLALLAVIVGAIGLPSDGNVLLLVLALLVGLAFPVMQAGIGQITSATGEPIAAAGLNFITVGLFTVLVVLLWGSLTPSDGWHVAARPEWFGGMIGAATVVVMAATVPVLGAFRLSVCVVSGQTLGAVVLDLLIPAQGVALTPEVCVSAVLTLLAVAVSGRSRIVKSG